MSKGFDVDVVIPTLNGTNIIKTINFLNKGSLRPKKIICIYAKSFNFYSIKKKHNNIVFFKSLKKGQVIQRNYGIKKTTSSLVLQLDDDILLGKNCLLDLVKAYKTIKKNSVIGPLYFNNKNKNIHKFNDNLFINIYKFLICDAPFGKSKIGKITSLALSYGVSDKIKDCIFKTDWLPGGCVLSNRKIALSNLQNFPFNGKAYCEDIFFSIIRKRKKIDHYVLTRAKVTTLYDNYFFSLIDFYREIKIRRFLITYLSGNPVRFYLWVFFEFWRRFTIKFLFSRN